MNEKGVLHKPRPDSYPTSGPHAKKLSPGQLEPGLAFVDRLHKLNTKIQELQSGPQDVALLRKLEAEQEWAQEIRQEVIKRALTPTQAWEKWLKRDKAEEKK